MTRTPDGARMVGTLELEATFDGQQSAIRAAQAWDRVHERLTGIGHDFPHGDQIGFVCFYLSDDTTVDELQELREMLTPHAVGKPTLRERPHFDPSRLPPRSDVA